MMKAISRPISTIPGRHDRREYLLEPWFIHFRRESRVILLFLAKFYKEEPRGILRLGNELLRELRIHFFNIHHCKKDIYIFLSNKRLFSAYMGHSKIEALQSLLEIVVKNVGKLSKTLGNCQKADSRSFYYLFSLRS